MHAPTLHSTFENSASSSSRNSSVVDFFATVLSVARSIFLSSLLWISLAFALYGVYTLILNTH
jgi:hypothetical protein